LQVNDIIITSDLLDLNLADYNMQGVLFEEACNACLHNYALYPVIRLYCGLILLEYATFF